MTRSIALLSLFTCLMYAQDTPPEGKKKRAPRPPLPGVSTPGVKREITTITPAAVFTVGATPDWQVVTDDPVWVTNGPQKTVHPLTLHPHPLASHLPLREQPP